MTLGGVITIDVDWAPDCAIDHCASMLLDAGVHATWFITHESPAVDRLRDNPALFELGIHPNFLPGTTHGVSESAILAHCMRMVPDARVVRTHGLFQSSNLLERIVDETPVRVDASLFLPHADAIIPVVYNWSGGKRLVRLPYVWEDDFEMVRSHPEWDGGAMIAAGTGLRILDFHPIHVLLNSSDLAAYRSIRARGSLADLSLSAVKSAIQTGPGIGDAFRSAIDALKGSPVSFLRNFQHWGMQRATR